MKFILVVMLFLTFGACQSDPEAPTKEQIGIGFNALAVSILELDREVKEIQALHKKELDTMRKKQSVMEKKNDGKN
jgi:hypothetical protein